MSFLFQITWISKSRKNIIIIWGGYVTSLLTLAFLFFQYWQPLRDFVCGRRDVIDHRGVPRGGEHVGNGFEN